MAGPRTNLEDVLARVASSSAADSSNAGQSRGASENTFRLARPATLHAAGSSRSRADAMRIPSAPAATLGSAILSPQSLNGSPVIRVGRAGDVLKPAADARPIEGPPPSARSGDSKLDSAPLEKLQAMVASLSAQQLDLLEKKADAEEDDDSLEDPAMLEAQIKIIGKRLKEVKEAIAQRGALPRPITTSFLPSSGQTGASGPRHVAIRPTPDTDSRRSTSHAVPSSSLDDMRGARRAESEDHDIPLAQLRSSVTRPAQAPRPPPRAEPDEADIADAEMDGMEANYPEQEIPHELIPPSSPPRPVTPPAARARAAVMDDFADLPPDAFSSPSPTFARHTRIEVSASRAMGASAHPSTPGPGHYSQSQAVAGPGPSSSAMRAQRKLVPAAPIKPDIKHKWTKEVEQKLRQVFGLPKFRLHQKEAIDETMAGKDVFVLMPTGGGKSLTYQLPAICSTGATRGVTFVISPLISLINDQTRHLSRKDIPAIAYTGDMTQTDKNEAHNELSRPEPWTKIVYVTPEMMSMGGRIKGIMRDLVRRQRLARFVVDEAHCVSQWGHDFRADYLKLGDLRQEYPTVPIMALTATAQNKVQDDIIRSLRIEGCAVLRQSFNRPNLHYEVRPKLKDVLGDMVGFIHSQRIDGADVSGIIYCGSRAKCEALAKELREKHGLEAKHYHAGMSKGDRRAVQEGWQEHEFEIIVATVAFGMGIDKPDVRYVIHHSLPRSLEGYYQETGRAGRDGRPSNCVLYYTWADSKNILSLIDRDEVLTTEQKERQKDNINEVMRFCMNKTDCRRSQVLSFFNETFDPNIYDEVDVSDDAISVLRMIEALHVKDRVTVASATEIWRGANKASLRAYTGNPFYGAGGDWERTEGERLLKHLLLEKGLAEFSVTNNGGWSNSYLKLGPRARDYMNGKKTLTMEFRQKSPAKNALKRTKSAASAGPDAAGKARRRGGQTSIDAYGDAAAGAGAGRVPSNPIARKRSLQQIRDEEAAFDAGSWGDSEDEGDGDYQPDGADPIVVVSDDGEATETDDAPRGKRRKSKGGVSDGVGVGVGRKQAKAASAGTKTALSRRRSMGQVRGTASLSAGAADSRGADARARGGGKGKGRASAPELAMSQLVELDDEDEDEDGGVELVDGAGIRQMSKSPVDACFHAMRAAVTKAYRSKPDAPKLMDEVMQMIAATMPQNLDSLGAIEGMTDRHIKSYGPIILGQTVKFRGYAENTPAYAAQRSALGGATAANTVSFSGAAARKAAIGAAGSSASISDASAGGSKAKSMGSIQSFAYKPSTKDNVPVSLAGRTGRVASTLASRSGRGTSPVKQSTLHAAMFKPSSAAAGSDGRRVMLAKGTAPRARF